jgi:nucleoside 2-deoxyribosyltransferase
MKKSKPMLYLAGPLFTEAERSFNETLRDILSEFFDVFLPQEAGLIGETDLNSLAEWAESYTAGLLKN